MSKNKSNIPKGENKDARFRRVAEPRILKMLQKIDHVYKMTKQPTYTIYDIDAQKILDLVKPVMEEFIATFTAIANNEKKEKPTEETIDHVF